MAAKRARRKLNFSAFLSPNLFRFARLAVDCHSQLTFECRLESFETFATAEKRFSRVAISRTRGENLRGGGGIRSVPQEGSLSALNYAAIYRIAPR